MGASVRALRMRKINTYQRSALAVAKGDTEMDIAYADNPAA